MPSTRVGYPRQPISASHQGSGHPNAITVAQTPLRSVQRSIPPFYGQMTRSAAVPLTTFVTSPRAAAEISLPTLRRSIPRSFPWQTLSFPRAPRPKCRCQRRGDPFRGCFHRKTDRSLPLCVDGPRSNSQTDTKRSRGTRRSSMRFNKKARRDDRRAFSCSSSIQRVVAPTGEFFESI